MQLIANISLLFSELPLLLRFRAAADAGFDGVEIQFPYSENLTEIRRASDAHEMPVVLINVPAGDMAKGDAGLAALVDREREYQNALVLCEQWARELAVRKINVLAGCDADNQSGEQLELLAKNLTIAGDIFAEINVAVQLEAINPVDIPGFLVPDLRTALDVLEATDHQNVHLQFDFYHMARTEPSLVEAIRKAGSYIGHVQFADTPGRHEPGTGIIDFPTAIQALKETGYSDCLSAEYLPHGDTADGLAWMPEFRKSIDG